jgi:hypothetical protein
MGLLKKRPSFAAGKTRADDARPRNFPRIPAALGRQIDEALELLRSVPFEEPQRRGWHLQPNHPDWPLNDVPFLRAHPELWLRETVPPEVDWDLDGQVELLRELGAFTGELADVPDGPPDRPGQFVWDNGTFARDDALAYYTLVRHLAPRRVIEVGAGWSSLVLAKAVAANRAPCDVTLIEPSPNRRVLGELPERWNIIEGLVQLVDVGMFETLEAGDVLFYDGSHCVRTGSDVNWIFFEVLPRLRPGVWIHVHDVLWPSDYAPSWVLDNGITWNEQYLAQAFLMGNLEFRVRLAVRMINALRPAEVASVFPDGGPGGSLWIEKVAG